MIKISHRLLLGDFGDLNRINLILVTINEFVSTQMIIERYIIK